jgi:AraC-like DNA-binding protein
MAKNAGCADNSGMESLNQTVLPHQGLRPYISHYWLSRDNREERYTVLPDGAVDLVLVSDGVSGHAHVYGTTTASRDVALLKGVHYLGVRFRPGQSRHFLRAAAVELTDTCEAAAGLLAFELRDIPERLATVPVFDRLDAALVRHLQDCPPSTSALDAAIQALAAAGGDLPVSQAAAVYGKSQRQFERQFLQTVGVGPKLYARIERFQRAARLVSASTQSLAEIAAALGYSDQSHMSHEFRRFAGLPPAAHARRGVDFLQYG